MEWLESAFFFDASEGKVAEKRKRQSPAKREEPGCPILWQQGHPSWAIQTRESCAGTCTIYVQQPIFQLCTPPCEAFLVRTRVDVPLISLERYPLRGCPAPYSHFSDIWLPIDLARLSEWPIMATTHPPWERYHAPYLAMGLSSNNLHPGFSKYEASIPEHDNPQDSLGYMWNGVWYPRQQTPDDHALETAPLIMATTYPSVWQPFQHLSTLQRPYEPGDISARHTRPVQLPLPLSTTDPPTFPTYCDNFVANGSFGDNEKDSDRPDINDGRDDVCNFHRTFDPNHNCTLHCNFTDNCMSIFMTTTIPNFPGGLNASGNANFTDNLLHNNNHGYGPDASVLQEELGKIMCLGGMRYYDNVDVNESFGSIDRDNDRPENGGGWNDNCISISMTIFKFPGGFKVNYIENINYNLLHNHNYGFGPDTFTLQGERVKIMCLGGMRSCDNFEDNDSFFCHLLGDISARYIRPVELPLPLSTTDPPTSPITCDSLDANGGSRGNEKDNDRPDNGGGGDDVCNFHHNCGPNPHCILLCNFTDNCISISETISNHPRGFKVSCNENINYNLLHTHNPVCGPDTSTPQGERLKIMCLRGMRYCLNFDVNDSFGYNDMDKDRPDNGGDWNDVYNFFGPNLHYFLLCTNNYMSVTMTISNFHGGFNFNDVYNFHCLFGPTLHYFLLCTNNHMSVTMTISNLHGGFNFNVMTTLVHGIITGQSRTVTVSFTSKVPVKTPRYE